MPLPGAKVYLFANILAKLDPLSMRNSTIKMRYIHLIGHNICLYRFLQH